MTDASRRKERMLALTPYLMLGFVALLLALLVRAPSSLLQKTLPSGGPVKVVAWGGSLWHGQAEVLQAGEPGFWRWEVQPAALLRARLALDLKGQGGLDLSGRLERGLGEWVIRDLSGTVSGRLLTPLLPAGWSLPGEVTMGGVHLARQGLARGPWLVASGQMNWGGGAMQYNLGSQSQAATLPPLVAGLTLDGETLVLSLAEAQMGAALAEVRMAPDGAMETRLRERLLRYSGRTSGASLDAVVVTSVQPAP